MLRAWACRALVLARVVGAVVCAMSNLTSFSLRGSTVTGHGLSVGSLRSLSSVGGVLGVSSSNGVKLPGKSGLELYPATMSSSKSVC